MIKRNGKYLPVHIELSYSAPTPPQGRHNFSPHQRG